jgi:hypothetical protein
MTGLIAQAGFRALTSLAFGNCYRSLLAWFLTRERRRDHDLAMPLMTLLLKELPPVA